MHEKQAHVGQALLLPETPSIPSSVPSGRTFLFPFFTGRSTKAKGLRLREKTFFGGDPGKTARAGICLLIIFDPWIGTH